MAGFNLFTILASAVLLISFLPVATPIVFGLDLGADWIKIAVVKPGKIPIQVVLNDASKRKTPTTLGYDGDERQYGDTALTLGLRTPKATFPHVKALLGESYSAEHLQKFGTFHFPYEVVEDTRRGTFGMKFKDTIFAPEELIAQIIDHARDQTEKFSNATVKDVVITVPSFYTQAHRQAVLDAAEIAGVNVLSLISDHTAVALKYGIDGNADSFDEGRNVVFYDMGAGSTKVSLVHFYSEPDKDRKNKTIGQLQVKGVAWDETLGGAAFSERLLDMFVKGSKEDPTGSPRAMAKMYKEAEKVKQVLSANTAFTAQIESLINDYDFKFAVTREEFEAASADLFDRVIPPLAKVLKDADMTPEQIDGIEIVGGGVRIPKVQALLKEFMKRDTLDKGLNGDEAACLGAALYAASLSTAFRLRKFGVKDITPFAVSVDVDAADAAAAAPEDSEDSEGASTGKGKTYKLFKLHNALPSKKLMTFGKKDDFAVTAKYDAAEGKPEEPVARYEIGGIAAAHEKYPDAEKAKVNVAFRLNRNGMVEVEKAELVVEMTVMVDVEEPKPKKDKKKGKKKANATKTEEDKEDDKEEKKEAGEDKEKDEKKDEEKEEKEEKKDEEKEKKEGEKEEEKKEGEKEEKKEGEEEKKDDDKDEKKDEEKEKDDEKKEDDKEEKKDEAPKPKKQKPSKRIHRVSLQLSAKSLGKVAALGKEDKKNSTALLKELELKDFKLRERGQVHNNLESFIYEFKEKLEEPSDEIKAVTIEEQLAELKAALEEAGEWLYGDGEDASTDEYREKLGKLTGLQKPIWLRMDEAERRPGMIEAARNLINATKTNLAEVSVTKEWITDKIKEPAYEAVAAFEKWLDETIAKQDATPAHEKPSFYVRDIAERYKSRVETIVTNALHTVKPKPKPVKKDNSTKTEDKDKKEDKEGDKEEKEEKEEDKEDKEDKEDDEKEGEEEKKGDAEEKKDEL